MRPDPSAPPPDPCASDQTSPDLPIGLCLLDPAGQLTWIHPLVPAAGDDTRSPFVERLRLLAATPEFDAAVCRVRSGGGAERHRWPLVDATDACWFDLTFTPLPGPDGARPTLRIAIQEVTEQLREIGRLTYLAERYRLIADFTYDWEYWRGPDGTLLWMSPSCERVTGYAVADFESDPGLLVDIAHPDDRAILLHHIREEFGLDESCVRRFRILRPDGEVRWIEHICQAVRGPDGRFAGRRASNRDITEVRRAKDALRARERELATLIDNAPDIIARFDSGLRHLYVNAAVEKAMGRPAEELLGRTLSGLGMPPRLYRHWEAILRQVFATGLPQDGQFNYPGPDGELHLSLRAVPEPGADGTVETVLCVTRDDTARHRVEQALRESETQFRLMFELATVGMALLDPYSRQILRVNRRLCWLLGYEADELLGMSFYDLTHPDDRERDLVRYQQAVEQEEVDYFTEKRYVRKDGRDVWALVNAAFIRDQRGRPLRAVAAMIDITDRRRAEARARELAAVVECSSDFIGIASLDGCGLYLNQAGQALVGLDGDAAVRATRIEDFLFPEDLACARASVFPALWESGRWSGEFRFRHFVTGEPIEVHWNLLRIDDPESGKPLQLATVTRDIRKEKAAEYALLEADQRKDEFLAMLGHELRNPMAPIRNAVEIMRAVGIGDDPRIAWAVEVLDRQTAHMGRLLDDLLDVSRIVRGRLELERRPLQVRDVVRQALDGVQSLMSQRRHRLLWELPSPEVLVDGDPVRLSQVLLNLLVNAANYTPEGGEVRVSSETADGDVLIRIRDNGQGMAPDQIEELFGLFASGARPPDAAAGGLGLGLAIAKRLTELHGGRLEAFSEGLGRGCELRVHLPLLEPAPADAQTPADMARHEVLASRMAEGEPLRILVVDDNPDVATALAMLLNLLGYAVETAASGPEALETARRQRPRVAMLDIGIPGMDGLELARRLRAEYPDPGELLLVALTGLGHEQARERSLAAGFDEHLVKPLEQKTLLELLERLRHAETGL